MHSIHRSMTQVPFLVQYKEMRPSGGRKPGGLFYSGANGPPKLQSADVSAVWCCSHAHRLASKSLETCDKSTARVKDKGNNRETFPSWWKIMMWPEKSRWFLVGSRLDVLPKFVRHGDGRDTIQHESIKNFVCTYADICSACMILHM